MARVLVVDDDAVNRDLVVTLLGYRGHSVVQAADGVEALVSARAEPPDLVLTDLLMPAMDGYELVREIRADPALEDTPVIFYTVNYLEREVLPVAAALGVRHIVSKPIDPQRLLLTVEEALAKRASAPVLRPDTLNREHLRALSAKLHDKMHELELSQEALRESEARFRTLAQFLPIGVFSVDTDAQVSYANPRLREICGLSDVATADADWAALLHPDDRERWEGQVRHAMDQRTSLRDRIRLVRPDGEQRSVQVQIVPVTDRAEQSMYVGTVEDVTGVIEAQRQRDAMESRLRLSERLEGLGQLAAGIAHDFNNLLAVIVNYAHFVDKGLEEVSEDYPDPRWAQMHDDASAISGAADRAAELTRQLLVFGSRDVAHPDFVDVNAVIKDALELLGRTIGEHVQLEHHLDERLQPVMSDRGQLEQVLMNLVVNARDAVGEGGVVAITTASVRLDADGAAMHTGAKPGTYALVTVTDDGEGMAPETITRAFEPFFTTKPDGQGTGLGLATVYGIVTRLGGSVRIYSDLGRGTAVRVYLPVTAEQSETEPRDSAQPSVAVPAGTGEVVLVSEDDDQIRAIAGRILTENGYSVVLVDRGAAALELLADESNRCDLLLSDVVMPHMSGRELAEHVAQVRPALPVLFMSGYAERLLAPGMVSRPGIDLLEKPFTQAALLAAVASALRPG